MRCAKCQHEFDASKRFCTNCGTAAGGSRCPNGHTVPEGLTECPFCPRPVRSGTVMDSPAPPPSSKRGATQLVAQDELQASGVVVSQQPGPRPPLVNAADPFQPPSGRKGTVFLEPSEIIAPSPPAVPTPLSPPAAKPSGFAAPLVGVLVSFSMDGNGQHWPVRFGRTALGADAGCEVVLARAGVSGRHAEIMVRDNRGVPKIWLTDNNSTNGTKLNGDDIFTDRPEMAHGDEIGIGGLAFTFMALPTRKTV